MAVIIVDNATDQAVGGETDLRQAVAAAHAGDTIEFAASVQSAGGAILNSQLNISASVTIDGFIAIGGNSANVAMISIGFTGSDGAVVVEAGRECHVRGRRDRRRRRLAGDHAAEWRRGRRRRDRDHG